MLSVLIPAYNYNVFPLVAELHRQLLQEEIDFEIIVGDDASTDIATITANEQIESLSHCIYHKNKINLGRGMNRNHLAAQANYSWLLLLDCDTMPASATYIKTYLDRIRSKEGLAFYGGIVYSKTRPAEEELLRWIYGQKREAISADKRKKKPYESTLVSNLLIRKELLQQYPFHSEITGYGFEDFVFVNQLKKSTIPIAQIENPVYHLNLETSVVFLEKHLKAIDNLKYLIARHLIEPQQTALSTMEETLTRLHLRGLFGWIFQHIEKQLRNNLLSNKPSLLLFDLYKLGYFCRIKN